MSGWGMKMHRRFLTLSAAWLLVIGAGLARAQSPSTSPTDTPTPTPTQTPTATPTYTPTATFTPHAPIRGTLRSLPGGPSSSLVSTGMATSHRRYLGTVPEGASTVVVASFFDSAPTPIPVLVDVVDCWVWEKGVDPTQVAPLFICETIEDPSGPDVDLELSPLATRIANPNSTSTERHYLKALGEKDGTFVPLEGEFDVISDPGLVVDPTTGVPGPVLPATPTPGS
jgi:hypothetical protein